MINHEGPQFRKFHTQNHRKECKVSLFLRCQQFIAPGAPFISQEEIGSWSSFSLKSSGWRCRVCLGQPSEVTSPTFPVALKNRNRFWGFGRIGPDLTLLTWVPMDNRGTYGFFFKLGDITTILESTPRTGDKKKDCHVLQLAVPLPRESHIDRRSMRSMMHPKALHQIDIETVSTWLQTNMSTVSTKKSENKAGKTVRWTSF